MTPLVIEVAVNGSRTKRQNAHVPLSDAELIDCIHQAPDSHVAFIVFNPAGFTHTSVALRDALLAVRIPFIEVHLSNVHAREEFRHHSYVSPIAEFVIAGAGIQGYEFAVRRLAHLLG